MTRPGGPGRNARTPRIQMVDAGGVRLRTCIRGEGRPLLLLSGIGATIEMWEPFEQALAGFPVQTISVDMPGTGGSPALAIPRRMPGLARIVDSLLDALGHPAVDVLGVSFGGALAQQFAHQAPRRVAKLILAATAPGVPGLGGFPGHPRALAAMATPRRYYDPVYLRAKAHLIYGGAFELGREHLDARLMPPSLRGYLYQLWAIQGWTALPWLWSLRQPTLVLAGDDDRITPAINGRLLACSIPGARLGIIRGGGHLFLIQRPHEVTPLVNAFLAQSE
jgi:poly(3-hydroxyoctanoate) depolymerase